ncbi:sulfatase-like hydrolase/transferase [Candidatus Woesearchaeota archaeon]|nr:sulfatase-like hydrolase/transferase [Candidatus Woesearchaeota archaeon]
MTRHLKLAAAAGLLAGSLIGTVDVLARIFSWSFEWFELYQALFISIAASVLFFLAFGFFVWLFGKPLKQEQARNAYVAGTISFILMFYGLVLVNNFLLSPLSIIEPASFSLSLLVVAVSAIFCFAIFLKGKNVLSQILLQLKKPRVKKFLGNYIFAMFVFAAVSLFIDVYMLHYSPGYKSDSRLKDYSNIILITIDATRADHLSLYGYQLNTTPNLNKLAEHSVVFDNAIAPGPDTQTSMASVLTGRYQYRHNTTLRNPVINEKELLISELLKDKGYVTTGMISAVYIKSKYGAGQGFMEYRDRLDFFEYTQTYNKFSMKRLLDYMPGMRTFIFRTDGERKAEEINRDAFRFLEKNSNNKFFLWVHYIEPHHPYNRGLQYRSMFSNERITLYDVWKTNKDIQLATVYRPKPSYAIERYLPIPNSTIEMAKALYDAEIYSVDSSIGKLIGKLDQLGLKDKTMIIITADHGEEFYDHGGFMHHTLYYENVHVPLLIYYPAKLPPKRIKETVSTIDIFSTVLDVANTESPGNVDSASLLPLIKTNKSPVGSYVISELYGRPKLNESVQQAIFDDGWKLLLIKPEDPKNRMYSSLFNINADPQEKLNLYNVNITKRRFLEKELEKIEQN